MEDKEDEGEVREEARAFAFAPSLAISHSSTPCCERSENHPPHWSHLSGALVMGEVGGGVHGGVDEDEDLGDFDPILDTVSDTVSNQLDPTLLIFSSISSPKVGFTERPDESEEAASAGNRWRACMCSNMVNDDYHTHTAHTHKQHTCARAQTHAHTHAHTHTYTHTTQHTQHQTRHDTVYRIHHTRTQTHPRSSFRRPSVSSGRHPKRRLGRRG